MTSQSFTVCSCRSGSVLPQEKLQHHGRQTLTILCGFPAQFVSDLVRNPENRFSHDAAHDRICLVSLLKGFKILWASVTALLALQGVQCSVVLVDIFFSHIFGIKFLCFVVAIFDLVYDVEAIHDLC